MLIYLEKSIFITAGRPIGPIGDNRIERISDRDNTRLYRDVFSFYIIRIALTIISFMMMQDDYFDFLEYIDFMEDIIAD